MNDDADVATADPAETPPPFGDGKAEDRLLPTPGVYLARGLAYAVVLLGVAAVAWAAITPLDVVVNARGRLMVRDEPIRVTPPEPGLATDVPVRVGDHVREGDLLVRLDSFKYGSELGQAQAEMVGLLAEIDRHSRSAREIREGEEFIRQQMETTDRAVTIESAKLETWRKAAAEGLASQIDLQTQERALIDVRSRAAQLRGELAARKADAAERDRQAVEGRAKADALAAKLRQLTGFERRMTLVSPVAGVVTQLAVLHPGSVVGTGEKRPSCWRQTTSRSSRSFRSGTTRCAGFVPDCPCVCDSTPIRTRTSAISKACSIGSTPTRARAGNIARGSRCARRH